MDEAEGMPLALARRQRVGRRHVELGLDQGRDQMIGEPGMDGIVPRLALLVVARGGALHPVGPPRSVDAGAGAASGPVRHVGDRLAAIDQHARHVVVVIDLLVVVADHDHRVEVGACQPVAQPIDRRHRLAVTPCVLVGRDLAPAPTQAPPPAGRRRSRRARPCEDARRCRSTSSNNGHSSAVMLSIGVCDVPAPKTMLAMARSSRSQLRGSWCFSTLPVALCGSSPRKRTSFGTL